METVSIGGRRTCGFALERSGVSDGPAPVTATPAIAAVAAGAAAGLLAHTLRAPLWGAIAAGCGAALVTKVGIDKAAETA